VGFSKRQFVDAGYEEIGMASYTFDLEPEQLQGALRTLDAMMAEWNAKGIRLGYPIPSTPDEASLTEATGVPDSANQAIITNLGLRLCPKHGKTPSPMTQITAKAAYNTLLSIACLPDEMRFPSMPAGAGNKPIPLNRPVFLDGPSDVLAVGPDHTLTLE